MDSLADDIAPIELLTVPSRVFSIQKRAAGEAAALWALAGTPIKNAIINTILCINRLRTPVSWANWAAPVGHSRTESDEQFLHTCDLRHRLYVTL
jgi:hypothetical protein